MSATAEPIAIIGMACRLPGARTPWEFWSNLVGETESISRPAGAEATAAANGDGGRYVRAVGRIDDVDRFDADFFRVPPGDASAMDPQHRVLLELSFAALEDAGYAGAHDDIIGVFAGSGENFYFNEHIAPNAEFRDRIGAVRVALANEKDFLAARIAFKLGMTGPCLSVQASCATSLTAVALGCQALAAGDCDVALAGGVSLLMPDVDGYEYTEGDINSADGRCRTFDRAGTGPVPASGAGAVVLKPLARALADGDNPYAVLRGWALNNDGASRAGFTVPNVDGQRGVIRRAMQRAGVRPRDVSLIEAHGTATPIGDPVEIEGLRLAFEADGGADPGSCAIGSAKTNIGHTDAAAGVAGLIKATLAVQTGIVPASLHFQEPNPSIDFESTPFYVNARTGAWPREGERIAGVSAFGLGGGNAHVILANADPYVAAPPERPRQLLALSARTEEALRESRLRLASWLEQRPELSPGELADVARTLAVGRASFSQRWAGAFATAAEAIAALRRDDGPAQPAARWSVAVAGTPREVAEMGRELVANERLVRQELTSLAGAAPEAAEDGLEGLTPPRAAALVALATIRALETMGLRFARIDAAPWARPAVRWLDEGGTPAELPAALDACEAAGDAGGQTRAALLTIGSGFEFADAIAMFWAAGGEVTWGAYHDSSRQRVSLPTYPFARERHWVDRIEAPAESQGQPAETAAANGSDESVADFVETVWREAFGLDAIDRDAHFLEDLDGDSVIAVEIGARLKARFGGSLPVDLPFVAPTIEATASYIEGAPAT